MLELKGKYPYLWDYVDINKWLDWIEKEFILPPIVNKSYFPDNGAQLCSMNYYDFANIVIDKESTKILFDNLNHLKRACGHQVDEDEDDIIDWLFSDDSSGAESRSRPLDGSLDRFVSFID
uniref:PNT domain-containing protein n=1 Tax=Tetranychus urticae TaxID=32264 RepID=T1KDQ6_TETUR